MSSNNSIHANALIYDGKGILIRGPSGSGKSLLTLSLLRQARCLGLFARLVADDRVFLSYDEDDHCIVSVPESIAGKIECYGFGILTMPYKRQTRLDLLIDLVPFKKIERMPENLLAPVTIEEHYTLPRLKVPQENHHHALHLIESALQKI